MKLGGVQRSAARLGVRRPLTGKIVKTLRAKGERCQAGPTRYLLLTLMRITFVIVGVRRCRIIVTLNPKDSPLVSLRAKVMAPETRYPVGEQQVGAGIREM